MADVPSKTIFEDCFLIALTISFSLLPFIIGWLFWPILSIGPMGFVYWFLFLFGSLTFAVIFCDANQKRICEAWTAVKQG